MNVKERTDNLITQRSFSICSSPIQVIRDFKEFCRFETKDDYSLGLKLLLERDKAKQINLQQQMKIQELEQRLIGLENKPEEEEEEKTKVKTFGGGERK